MDISEWHKLDPLNCPAVRALETISGKWKPAILFALGGGVRRFGELQKAIPTISHKTLTQQLRELEDAGVVDRRVYAVVPPKTEYSLTASGEALGPIFLKLYAWGEEHAAH
ncbi:winged helix-turn-helix transcriptional regulator [Rhizobium sp. NRK18]|uniref:winged helix-turn-helix transcriptional regulator n=1 Tax=Rhizobium sp. NRK18 TaxID=2964667 RepID=UPI0021C4861F|nr:helix-turn-helix domain-containing protein [Rhizobium sp. NRK18]MCQ2003962.1 helix-turn-helix transcriptional regulator [Rhizobium sp. NRK18]